MSRKKLQQTVTNNPIHPTNGMTQKGYKNTNKDTLNTSFGSNSYNHNVWGTEKQYNRVGVSVIKKGETTNIVDRFGKETEIFNISQTDFFTNSKKKSVSSKASQPQVSNMILHKSFSDTEYGDMSDRKYYGDIDVSGLGLTSLDGAPKVCGDFYCSDNMLTSLDGAPDIVMGKFDCRNNVLTSLYGVPSIITGRMSCNNNLLESLEGLHYNFSNYTIYFDDEDREHEFEFLEKYQFLSDDERKIRMWIETQNEYYYSKELLEKYLELNPEWFI